MISSLKSKFVTNGARLTTRLLPNSSRLELAKLLLRQYPDLAIDAVGSRLNRAPNLDNMPLDLLPERPFRFEQLAGLFSSTSLDSAVIAMTVREAAYIFGLIRTSEVRRTIEIGRYKGGCTLLMAMAMAGEGELWSIDQGEKEARLKDQQVRSYDQMLADRCERLGLKNVHMLLGDSRTIEVDTGAVDLVVIDGDHTFAGVKNDFERFGRRVRKGGAVLFHDGCSDWVFTKGDPDVRRFVEGLRSMGDFRFVKAVDRLAHFEKA